MDPGIQRASLRSGRSCARAGALCATTALVKWPPFPSARLDSSPLDTVRLASTQRPSQRPAPPVIKAIAYLLKRERSTPSARADRQEPLPMFRCPGLPGFP